MTRNPSDKLARLRAVDLFQRCTDPDIQALAAITEEVHLERGAVLCEQGRVADCCFVLIEGEAEIVVGGRLRNIVYGGETIGEMGLIDHLPRSATVTARTAIDAYRIPAEKFEALLVSTAISRGLLEQLSRRIRDLLSGRSAAT
jgi:CRP-like cAMP-binding protein